MGQADLRYHPNCHAKDMTTQFSLTQSYAALSHGGSGVAVITFPRGLSPTDPSLSGSMITLPFTAKINYSTLHA